MSKGKVVGKYSTNRSGQNIESGKIYKAQEYISYKASTSMESQNADLVITGSSKLHLRKDSGHPETGLGKYKKSDIVVMNMNRPSTASETQKVYI